MFNKKLTPEQVVLAVGLVGFFLFLWLMVFFLTALRSYSPLKIAFIPALVRVTATPAFVLPPTWTPTPAYPVISSPVATTVAEGQLPTRIYTPRPTSLPGLPMPVIIPRLTALDLARIMQGESPGDREAAYMVGWVAKNRLLHPGYGDTYAVVSHGFFGYRPHMQPNKEFMSLAGQVIKSTQDPTGGCLYALSRTDITKLRVPPQRADVAFGEWFFFRTWPLSAR